jgi:hypothetical protein
MPKKRRKILTRGGKLEIMPKKRRKILTRGGKLVYPDEEKKKGGSIEKKDAKMIKRMLKGKK